MLYPQRASRGEREPLPEESGHGPPDSRNWGDLPAACTKEWQPKVWALLWTLRPPCHHQKPRKNKAIQKTALWNVNVWSFTIPRVYQSQITNVPAIRTFSVPFLSSQSQFTTTLEELVWERRNWIAEWRKGGELTMHSLSHYSISPLRQAWASGNEKL